MKNDMRFCFTCIYAKSSFFDCICQKINRDKDKIMTDDLRELYFYSFAFDKCNCNGNVYPSRTDVGQNVFFEVVFHHFVPIVTIVKQRSEGVKVFTAFGLVHDVCLTPYVFVIDKSHKSESIKEVVF